MKKNRKVLKLCYAAVCLAIALLLPRVTGQIPEIGRMLSPMHIPVFLAGFLCGTPWGAAVGVVAPILNSLLFMQPVMFPKAIAMACELATYGALSGFLSKRLPKKIPFIYVTLIISMICGRVVWGLMRFILAGLSTSAFPFSAFIAGAVTDAIPGIIAVIVLVPIIVMALRRAKLDLNE